MLDKPIRFDRLWGLGRQCGACVSHGRPV